MRLATVRKDWRGFVPAYYPHALSLCAFYHCKLAREHGRYCDTHARQYEHEAGVQGVATVLPFPC